MPLTYNKLQEKIKDKNCQLVLDSSFFIAQVLDENGNDKAKEIFNLAEQYNSVLNTNRLIWSEIIITSSQKVFYGYRSQAFEAGLAFANKHNKILKIYEFDQAMAIATAKIKIQQKTGLSLPDCSILALANSIPNSVLLTRDKALADSCGKQAVFRWV